MFKRLFQRLKSAGKPPAELVEEAKAYPDGWVYQIAGDYDHEGYVPPGAIMGGWKVDSQGLVVPGSFEANPNYRTDIRGIVFHSAKEYEDWCEEHDA